MQNLVRTEASSGEGSAYCLIDQLPDESHPERRKTDDRSDVGIRQAHEPRPRRHGRVSKGQEKGQQVCSACSRLCGSRTSDGRIRRKAYTGSHYPPWHADRFLLRRVTTASRSVGASRPERTWRSTSDIASGNRNQQTSRARTTNWVEWTSAGVRSRRSTAEFPWWCTSSRLSRKRRTATRVWATCSWLWRCTSCWLSAPSRFPATSRLPRKRRATCKFRRKIVEKRCLQMNSRSKARP